MNVPSENLLFSLGLIDNTMLLNANVAGDACHPIFSTAPPIELYMFAEHERHTIALKNQSNKSNVFSVAYQFQSLPIRVERAQNPSGKAIYTHLGRTRTKISVCNINGLIWMGSRTI